MDAVSLWTQTKVPGHKSVCGCLYGQHTWSLPVTLLRTVWATGLGKQKRQWPRKLVQESLRTLMTWGHYLEVRAVEELVESWQLVHVQVLV